MMMNRLYYVKSIFPFKIVTIGFYDKQFKEDENFYYIGNISYSKLFSTLNPEEIKGLESNLKEALSKYYKEMENLLIEN